MTLKIATRLWIPSLVVTGLLLLLASLTTWQTVSQIAQADAQAQRQESKLYDAATWQGLTTANSGRVIAGIASSDAAVAASFKPQIAATSARIDDIFKRVESQASSADEQAALGRTAAARKTYLDARKAAAKTQADGDADAARSQLASLVQPALATYLASQQAYVTLQQNLGVAQRAELAATRRLAVWGLLGMLSLVVLGLLISTWLAVRSICAPMDRLISIAQRIGQGDLGVEIEHRGSDEIGAVMQALTNMRDALRGIVGEVRQSAESIQLASAEVASGNLDLSQRTEHAAAQLQQAASALEQFTGNVRQSADAATQANQLAVSASAVARRGGDVVAQVVGTMDQINDSSKRIADIVGTIDGIAFQTNILALNAAVEAARAGEQGRGFAVVASEVRSLAQRSAAAAREIKALISASVDRVDTGAKLVRDAGSTMAEIVSNVQRVADIIGEISAAAAEQRHGIVSVNGAVSQLDQMTQQNAALVEQSAAAAQSLREQAQRLSLSMQVFRLSSAQTDDGIAPVPGSSPLRLGTGNARPSAARALAPAPPAVTMQRHAAATAAATTPTAMLKRAAAPSASRAPLPTSTAQPHGDDWETF